MDCILTLDVGSSSARTLLFSFDGKQIDGFGSQVQYRARTTDDGGWEIDGPQLTDIVARSFTEICAQMRAKNVKPVAVAVDTFWHSIMGVSADGEAVTPIFHPFDSRSEAAAKKLAARVDNIAQHSRTGCMLHPSYPPPKLLWLSETQPDTFRAVQRWMTAGEYLFLEFFGKPSTSTSIVSGSGLWDQNANDYDEQMLAALPIRREQLASPGEMDQPSQGLKACFRQLWPELDGIPWFPALGDGACDSIGSGCATQERWALMVGTSGALRATIQADRIDIPRGLFCYRVDRTRFVTGGALSNGGEVYAWMKRTLKLPDEAETEKQLAAMLPGSRGLTVLPMFSGERSPEWRTDTHAVIAGLHSATTPVEILHAALEAVALRFRDIYEIMKAAFGRPQDVIASGAALGHSPVWTGMMADALGHWLTLCLEPEATSRGGALLGLERLKIVNNVADFRPLYGTTIQPDAAKKQLYLDALGKQRDLYRRLFEEN